MMPSSEETVSRLGGSTAFSGWVIGTYALGCLASLPLMLHWSRSSYKLGMVFAATAAVLGNALSFVSLEIAGADSKWFSLWARFVCGMEGGVAIVLSNMMFRSSAGRGAVQAWSEYFLAGALGFAMGPWMSSLTLLANLHIKPEGPPALLMICMGFAYAALVPLLFTGADCRADKNPARTEPGGAAATDATEDAQSAEAEAVSAAWVHLLLQTVANAVRYSQRVACEAAALVLFTDAYGLSTVTAGFVVGLLPLGLIPLTFMTASLHEALGLMGIIRAMEAMQVVGLLLTLVRGSSDFLSLLIFVVGSGLFYSANWMQGMALSSTMMRFNVQNHWLLNLESTMGALWSFTYVGYFFGPIISRTLMQACLSQRALAASLGALLLGLAA
eukprot:CAMPEP_0168407114 /NCGR_PEP_ID=MMETSP0228-20121227/25997_1 /TAXON_ID=133427 /ORGANISM="Protoceratium reticulatum, Strain CCCM 535 (=CCMP 1889)" /LENGTH=386 /DNA_ID=CAMNT_0008420777 /DNA_START=18 /DNA_END=1174 /DNA_ORIENTATION=+